MNDIAVMFSNPSIRDPFAYRPASQIGSDDDDDDDNMATSPTDAVPPLTRGTSTASSVASSLDTGLASSILGDGYTLESQDGILTVPFRYQEDADLLCPFQILDCDRVFAEIVPFKMHVFSHFRGHELPAVAACFLCDAKFVQHPDDDRALAWNTMLSHMVHEHFRQGQHLATVRTDFSLMRWMFSKRIINEDQFSRTQMMPIPIMLPRASNFRREVRNLSEAPRPPSAPTPPAVLAHFASVGHQDESYTVNAGRRSERRRLDATRAIVRHRSYM